MFYLNAFGRILQERGWTVREALGGSLRLSWTAPGKRGITILADRETLLEDVCRQAENFSPDLYIIRALDDSPAPYGLLHDAACIQSELIELADALQLEYDTAHGWSLIDEKWFVWRRQVGTTAFEFLCPNARERGAFEVDSVVIDTAPYPDGTYQRMLGVLAGKFSDKEQEMRALARHLADLAFDGEGPEDEESPEVQNRGTFTTFDEARALILELIGDDAGPYLLHDENGAICNRQQALSQMAGLRLATLLSDIRTHPDRYPKGPMDWTIWLSQPAGRIVGATF